MSKDADLRADVLEELGRPDTSQTLKKALGFVSRKEFPLPRRWSSEELDMAEFPSDVTKISIDELGRLMGIWTSVMGYTQFEVAKADVEATAKANKLMYEQEKLALSLREKEGVTEADRKSMVRVDEGIAKLKAQYEVAKAKHKLVDAMLKTYGRYYAVLSRELSRRGQEPVEPSGERVSKASDADRKEFLAEIEQKKGSLFKDMEDEE